MYNIARDSVPRAGAAGDAQKNVYRNVPTTAFS